MKCKDCKLFQKDSKDDELGGFCHARSPFCKPCVDDDPEIADTHYAIWPWVGCDDWCGEFMEEKK